MRTNIHIVVGRIKEVQAQALTVMMIWEHQIRHTHTLFKQTPSNTFLNTLQCYYAARNSRDKGVCRRS